MWKNVVIGLLVVTCGILGYALMVTHKNYEVESYRAHREREMRVRLERVVQTTDKVADGALQRIYHLRRRPDQYNDKYALEQATALRRYVQAVRGIEDRENRLSEIRRYADAMEHWVDSALMETPLTKEEMR